MLFLAVQDSSIGDLVTESLSESLSASSFDFRVTMTTMNTRTTKTSITTITNITTITTITTETAI